MVGVTWKAAKARPAMAASRAASQPPPAGEAERRPSAPAVSFRDKEAYQELFRPLPRPEPIPALSPVKIEGKSWRQLQEEREALISSEIERTRLEAEDMWARAQAEDSKRLQILQRERERQEAEQRAREEILAREKEEREVKDRARRESIKRQEQLLSGRQIRAKTTDRGSEEYGQLGGGGIQVYHYKDPAVVEILKRTARQELERAPPLTLPDLHSEPEVLCVISKSKSSPEASSLPERVIPGTPLLGSRSAAILNGLASAPPTGMHTNGGPAAMSAQRPDIVAAGRVTGNKPPLPAVRPSNGYHEENRLPTAAPATEVARPVLPAPSVQSLPPAAGVQSLPPAPGVKNLQPAPGGQSLPPPASRMTNGGTDHLAGSDKTLPPTVNKAITPGTPRRFGGPKFGSSGFQANEAAEAYNTYKAVMGSKEFFRVGMMDR